jgi:glyoxylase-like metal-dependent hydrolase (beta-lactamase superfamily II)
MQKIADGVYTRQSRYWQTNTGIIESPSGAVLVDPGVFPDELDELAQDLNARNLEVISGITTHEHWDHILWAAGLGSAVPRYASDTSAAWAEENRNQISLWLESEEAAHGVQWERELVARLTPVRHGQSLLDELNAEFLALPGHTIGHCGLWLPDPGVLFVGDMISDIDPPSLSSGDPQEIESYFDTLSRIEDLLNQADVVVPGHGTVCDSAEGLRRLELDRTYLTSLIKGTAGNFLDDRLASDTGQLLHRQNVRELLEAHTKRGSSSGAPPP